MHASQSLDISCSPSFSLSVSLSLSYSLTVSISLCSQWTFANENALMPCALPLYTLIYSRRNLLVERERERERKREKERAKNMEENGKWHKHSLENDCVWESHVRVPSGCNRESDQGLNTPIVVWFWPEVCSFSIIVAAILSMKRFRITDPVFHSTRKTNTINMYIYNIVFIGCSTYFWYADLLKASLSLEKRQLCCCKLGIFATLGRLIF